MDNPPITFLATIANLESPVRDTEYRLCLSRVFSYGFPVYGVVSECTSYPVVDFFPFKHVVYIESTLELDAPHKSRKEFVSMKRLCQDMKLDDSAWVIKVSGRYMLVDDSFVERVTSSSKQAIVRLGTEDQVFTFLFAIRFKLLREIFLNTEIGYHTNIEYHVLQHLRRLVPESEIEYVDRLGVLTNIANGGKYEYF